jgi:hypothetical protein
MKNYWLNLIELRSAKDYWLESEHIIKINRTKPLTRWSSRPQTNFPVTSPEVAAMFDTNDLCFFDKHYDEIIEVGGLK